MVIFGLILALLGFFLGIQILWVIGIILLIVGLVLWLVPIGGRTHRYY